MLYNYCIAGQFSSHIDKHHLNLFTMLDRFMWALTLLLWHLKCPHSNLLCKVMQLTPNVFDRPRNVLLLFNGIVTTLDRSKSFRLRPTLPFFCFETLTFFPCSICLRALPHILSTFLAVVSSRVGMTSLSFFFRIIQFLVLITLSAK